MGITRSYLRELIQEEMEKSAPFGSGMEKVSLDPEKKELIGHT
jgi:hypothetical protein